jgi:hypothetical protein
MLCLPTPLSSSAAASSGPPSPRATAAAATAVRHTQPLAVEQFACLLNTGDMVFFCGHSLLARIIELFGRTQFSHVCMADVAGVDMYGAPESQLLGAELPNYYLWESVYHEDACRCELAKRSKSGVRLVNFFARMETFFDELKSNTATVALVKLELFHGEEQYRQISDRLHAFQPLVHARPYELDLTALVQSQYSRLFGQAPREDATVFCSELMALSYQAMGLWPVDYNPNVSLHALSYDSPTLPFLHARLVPRIDYYTVVRTPYSIGRAIHSQYEPEPMPLPEPANNNNNDDADREAATVPLEQPIAFTGSYGSSGSSGSSVPFFHLFTAAATTAPHSLPPSQRRMVKLHLQ